jgi:hypothetical protein
MSVYSPEYHAMISSPTPTPTPSAPGAKANTPQDEGFFHHLLDVVNPLQHLPIIGTIYRAITGEHIGTVEKIAGDTLYGGLWGAVSSIADVAFEGITGKSMEDTVLAWFKSDNSIAVASTKVTAPAIDVAQSLPSSELPSLSQGSQVALATAESSDTTALSAALSAKGVSSDIAIRALYAYRRSMDLFPPVLATAN